tara:strand:- start:5 stop:481 length:477 start_codon:yes stop_codon:yes gene_type:complete
MSQKKSKNKGGKKITKSETVLFADDRFKLSKSRFDSKEIVDAKAHEAAIVSKLEVEAEQADVAKEKKEKKEKDTRVPTLLSVATDTALKKEQSKSKSKSDIPSGAAVLSASLRDELSGGSQAKSKKRKHAVIPGGDGSDAGKCGWGLGGCFFVLVYLI